MTSADAPPAIETIALSKRYRRVAALVDLTMNVGRGEIFGFLGPNGAGKTTALKLLLGLVHPTSGAGEVLGAPLGDLDARRHIGYLPELFRYQDWLSAREVLALHCRLARIPKAQRAGEIEAALETVGLAARADDRVATFSKGMQQRLGLGVAMLGAPQLIFLDEPTSALDPVGRHDVRAIIESLRTRGTTVFLNSHLLTEVERVSDRVAIVDKGAVIAIGTIDELLGRTSSVRLQLAHVERSARAVLERYGAVTPESEHAGTRWFRVDGVVEGDVPLLVSELVRAGASVYAVAPQRATLEERFIELLNGAPDADPDDRLAHTA